MVFDFLTGALSFEDFMKEFVRNPEIVQWLDDIGNFQPEIPKDFPKDFFLQILYKAIRDSFDGHAMKFIQHNSYQDPEIHHHTISEKYCHFSTIQTVVLSAFPKLKCTRMYKQDETFCDKAVSRSIGGQEVIPFLDQVLSQFPRTMKAADRVKAGRAAVQEAFHIHDRKFPCWPQEPEWPMGKNSPMEYLGRHKDGELVQLRFRDVDTGEERIVEQYY